MKPVDGHNLKIHRIPISNCVMISDIGSRTGTDTLEFYFENKKRSDGGEIEKIEHKQDEGICFIYFKDHKGAIHFCLKIHHF